MKKKLTIIFLLTCLFLSTNISAQDYGVSLRASTLGISGDVARSFGENFNLRVGFSAFSYTYDGDYESDDGEQKIDYTMELKPLSVHILADYFPFKNNFRLTGGFLINLNKFDLEFKSGKNIEVSQSVTYTPEELGSINSDIDFNAIAPFLGMGFGNVALGKGVKFNFEVGTIYQGAPSLDLSASERLEPTANDDNEAQIEDNISWFKWYPVLSLGITYNF